MMKASESPANPDSLSRIELISSYVNGYAELDDAGRADLEAELARRGLPVPDMSRRGTKARPGRPRAPAGGIDRETLLSYILLIYTGTAIFYSWYYLAERLIRRDCSLRAKHKIIQTGISLFYAAADILILSLLAGD
jgi:hypothetical protein